MIFGRSYSAILAALMLSGVSAVGLPATPVAPSMEVVAADALAINPANGLRMHEGAPFTGMAQRRFPDGSVAESDSFRDGLRHGPSRIWFPNGQLGYEAHYSDGLREGQTRTWWEDGKRRSQTLFVADRQEGEAWEWYETGELYKRHNYSAGAPSGLQQAWRRNGELYENFEIRGGRSYGLRNAKICYEITEQDGVATLAIEGDN